MTSVGTGIERHPDIAALRMRYEQAAETPAAQLVEGLGFMAGLYLAISPWVLGLGTARRFISGSPTLSANISL